MPYKLGGVTILEFSTSTKTHRLFLINLHSVNTMHILIRLRVCKNWLNVAVMLCTCFVARADNHSRDSAVLNRLFVVSERTTNRDSLIQMYKKLLPLAIEIGNDSMINGFS